MTQHATMHGKTVEDFNGQPGRWVPLQVNSAGQLSLAPIAGEFAQFNRTGAGSIVKKSAVIAADTLVVSGACILYGIKVVTAGTSVTVFDNTAASGVSVITAEATTAAGTLLTPAGPGVGVLMDNGIFLDLTGGTYIVYFADQT